MHKDTTRPHNEAGVVRWNVAGRLRWGATSEPAFDVSQVCLRVRGLFGLTSEFVAVAQIERGQGGARLENNDVTCGAMTAVGVFV